MTMPMHDEDTQSRRWITPAGAAPALPPELGAQGLGRGAVLGALDAAVSVLLGVDAAPPVYHARGVAKTTVYEECLFEHAVYALTTSASV